MSNNATSYSTVSIHAPFLISKVPVQFLEKNPNIIPLYKIDVLIQNDNLIEVKLGIKLIAEGIESEDLSKDTAFMVIVEEIGVFNIQPAIPSFKSLAEFPTLANLVATIFPFSRERVTSLLSTAGIQYFLESFNVVNFLKEFESTIPIIDKRVQSAPS